MSNRFAWFAAGAMRRSHVTWRNWCLCRDNWRWRNTGRSWRCQHGRRQHGRRWLHELDATFESAGTLRRVVSHPEVTAARVARIAVCGFHGHALAFLGYSWTCL